MNSTEDPLTKFPKTETELISVSEAKLILSPLGDKYTDWEIHEILELVESFGNFIILTFLSNYEKEL